MTALESLAREAGICVSWTDAGGKRRRVSSRTLRAILDALGYPAGGTREIRASHALLKRQRKASPLQVVTANHSFPAKGRALRLTAEDGKIHILPVRTGQARAALPPGYYRLDDDRRIAVTPARAFAGEKPAWGVGVQLYSLRGSPEIGDFAALAALCEQTARVGGNAVMLSPVHALPHGGISPYTPTSRQFLNPLYIPVAGKDDGNREIDWGKAERDRLRALRRTFRSFEARGGDTDFDRFVQQGGKPLRQHARFMAQGRDDLRFQLYLQWRADLELARAQARAKAAGMAIGLIADVAVGVDPCGSEASGNPDEMLQGLSIGAPPDAFNQDGQNWGLTGFSPSGLIASGFDGFIRTLRAAMRHAGGVRLDHAMGLMRLWVVPAGMEARDGAYLQYPFEALLGLLCLESLRHRALVIAEDLGTVPPRFRRQIERGGLLGMDVLWFTRDRRGHFIPPARWAADRTALTTTHDLPTLAGWWMGHDLDWQEKISAQPNPSARRQRQKDRHALWGALCESGPRRPMPADAARFIDGVMSALAQAPSVLKLIAAEDFIAEIEQPNIPGTIDQHPNWRRRLKARALFASAAARHRAGLLAGALR